MGLAELIARVLERRGTDRRLLAGLDRRGEDAAILFPDRRKADRRIAARRTGRDRRAAD